MVGAHVELDDSGRAWITGANVKVIEVALDMVAYGWGAEQIHEEHPDLSLAEIHSALAYYYDHQAELDREMRAQAQEAERLAAAGSDSPVVRRLRERGLLG